MLLEEWMTTIRTLAQSVRSMRLLLGWSQQDLADRAVCSQGAVSRIEAGKMGGIPLHTVVVVARALRAGCREIKVPLNPATRSLLNFAQDFNGELAEPIEPDLAVLLGAYNQLPPRQRAAFVQLVQAAVGLLSTVERSDSTEYVTA